MGVAVSAHNPSRPSHADISASQLLAALPDPAVVLDARGHVAWANDAWTTLQGGVGEPSRVVGSGASYADLCAGAVEAPGSDGAVLRDGVAQVLDGTRHRFELTYAMTTAGEQRWYLLRVCALPPSCGGALVTHTDVTSYKELELQLAHQASVDPLTGLPNRTRFARELARALDPHQPRGHVGVVYIDLDRFKPVNDTHGHDIGDAVLQTVARRLHAVCRPTDSVARLGGDEFALAVPGVDQTQLDALCGRIERAVAAPLHVRSLRLRLTASVGGHLARTGDSWEAVLRSADERMYVLKRQRRRWRSR